MGSLVYLIPVSIGLGVAALLVFFWSFRNGQYEDLDGASERILCDEDKPIADKPVMDKSRDKNVTGK